MFFQRKTAKKDLIWFESTMIRIKHLANIAIYLLCLATFVTFLSAQLITPKVSVLAENPGFEDPFEIQAVSIALTGSSLLLLLALIARKFSPEVKNKTSAGGTRPWTAILAFLIAGFMMKIVGEAVHELLGHGSFVLLFGGRVTHFYINLFWPYGFSYIGWSIPGASPDQMAWVISGGILVSATVSFLIQFLLLLEQIRWQFYMSLFWLSFWCYINATGYLIVGGVLPFGDVEELIRLGVLISSFATVIGTTLFLTGFFILSEILRRTLTTFLREKTRWGILAFWFIIPALVGLNMAGRGMFHFFLVPFSFIPILLSYLLEFQMKATKKI